MKPSVRHIRFSCGQVLLLAVTAVVLFLFQSVAVPGFFVAGSGTISELQAARQDTRAAIEAQASSHRAPALKVSQVSILFSRFLYVIPAPSVFLSPFRHLISAVNVAEYSSVPARAPPF